MYKVQDLKKQKNKSYLVTFLFENGLSQDFIVIEDLVVEYRLIKDKELSIEQYQSFLLSESIDAYFQTTLKYVIKYQKSEKETVDYLVRKGVSEELIQSIILKLKKCKIIDDEHLIEYLIDYHVNQLLSGSEKIRFLFIQKGFSSDLINEHLNQISTKTVEKNLLSLFSKRLPHYKNNSMRQAQNKMMTYLVSKGYELRLVQAFVLNHKDEFNQVIDETSELRREYLKIMDKSRKLGLTEDKLKQKVIQKLLSKGFQYQDIQKILERSF